MSDSMRKARDRVIDRVLNGPGMASAVSRQAAYDNTGTDERTRALLQKVARHAWKVTRGDIAAVKAAAVPEDEIFEIVVCAALGQATRQLRSALHALDEASPPQSVESVDPDRLLHGGGR